MLAQLARLAGLPGTDFNVTELCLNHKGLRDCGSLEEEGRVISLPTAIQALAEEQDSCYRPNLTSNPLTTHVFSLESQSLCPNMCVYKRSTIFV